MSLNTHAIRAIYRFEMARTFRTLGESIASPVLTTSLYFIVFGAAIGSRMGDIDGVSYGAFIIPGLVMLSLLSESISNASFGIYMPKWSGTIYELLSAPVSYVEVVLGYVGAAATKSLMLGLLILATARLFVPYEIEHPLWMLCFLVLTALSFSLFGFIIGLWADDFQKLQIIPLMVVTPLTFLGGAFAGSARESDDDEAERHRGALPAGRVGRRARLCAYVFSFQPVLKTHQTATRHSARKPLIAARLIPTGTSACP